jgi:hypothetical protein
MNPAALKRRIELRLTGQRRLVERLLEVRAQLPGSLFARYGRCGKSGCSCADGQGHGPYYVLSHRSGGRGSYAYLERGQVRKTREQVRRYREFRTGLQRLQQLNEELVELLRRYQEETAMRAGRALGLSNTKQEKQSYNN